MKIRLRHLIILSALPLFLAACGRPHPDHDQINEYTCAGNAYLSKYDCSIERIQRAAEEGNPDAQYALGYMYYYGISTIRDQETAGLWIKRAADQGQPLAKRAWKLINSGAIFSDLHQAAQYHGGKRAPVSHDSIYQPKADVTQLNVQTDTAPITDHLPAYQADRSKQPVLEVLKPKEAQPTAQTHTEPHQKISFNDPRLSSKAKPVLAQGLKPIAHKQPKPRAKQNTLKMAQYTMQLIGSREFGEVRDFVNKYHLAQKSHFYHVSYQGHPWYFVTYGQFKTHREAEQAIDHLPKMAQANRPWVRSMQSIRHELKQRVVG